MGKSESLTHSEKEIALRAALEQLQRVGMNIKKLKNVYKPKKITKRKDLKAWKKLRPTSQAQVFTV